MNRLVACVLACVLALGVSATVRVSQAWLASHAWLPTRTSTSPAYGETARSTTSVRSANPARTDATRQPHRSACLLIL